MSAQSLFSSAVDLKDGNQDDSSMVEEERVVAAEIKDCIRDPGDDPVMRVKGF
jgi:hypothetical protein